MSFQLGSFGYYPYAEILSVLQDFADEPERTAARFPRIMFQDDLANHLSHFVALAIQDCPDSVDLELIKTASAIDQILSDSSLGGPLYDEWFWTKKGFESHPQWARIRELARGFLLR